MRIALLILCVMSIHAADGGATITPAPGFEPPKANPQAMPPRSMPPAMMQRPSMAFEVELLVLAPGDVTALARWAELAALGYHVVSAVPGDGRSTLYLERSMLLGSAHGALRLPAGIPADATGPLKARIEAGMIERQQVGMGPRPVTPMPPEAK